MNGAKHTPGPWSIKNDYDERHIVIANIDESFSDGTTAYTYDFVCDTYGVDYESRSRDVANANARLIAAAPDLLSSLQRLLLEFDFMVEQGRIPDVRDDVIFCNARAAIAAAESRS